MDNVEYDVEKLKRFGEIDTDVALLCFSEPRDYFRELTSFVSQCDEYLTKYSEYQVSTRDEARSGFMREINELRKKFSMLGMQDAVLDLSYLEKAARGRSEDALKHEVSEFRRRISKISRIIVSARLEEASPERPAKKPVILAVDDMPGLLSATVKMLSGKYTVIALTSAQAALKAIEKQTPELFLLDIEMPVMNGFDLARELRAIERFAQTPILFLTALNTREDVITAITNGGNDYIVKPVDKELLISKIERYLP